MSRSKRPPVSELLLAGPPLPALLGLASWTEPLESAACRASKHSCPLYLTGYMILDTEARSSWSAQSETVGMMTVSMRTHHLHVSHRGTQQPNLMLTLSSACWAYSAFSQPYC